MAVTIQFPEVDLTGVKGVLIDLDDTLYAYSPCHDHALSQCYALVSDHLVSEASFRHLYREKRTEITEALRPQGACRSRLFAFQNLCNELGMDQPYAIALRLKETYWESFRTKMTVFPEAKRFLESCQNNAIPVCIVTDMLAQEQIKKVQALGISDAIRFIVSSEEAGAEKPDPKPFNLALSKLNLSYGDVIMIGDSEEKDIQGARSLGIMAYKVEKKTDA